MPYSILDILIKIGTPNAKFSIVVAVLANRLAARSEIKCPTTVMSALSSGG